MFDLNSQPVTKWDIHAATAGPVPEWFKGNRPISPKWWQSMNYFENTIYKRCYDEEDKTFHITEEVKESIKKELYDPPSFIESLAEKVRTYEAAYSDYVEAKNKYTDEVHYYNWIVYHANKMVELSTNATCESLSRPFREVS